MAHRATTRTVAATALALGALTLLGTGVAGTAYAAPSAPPAVQTAANVASTITLDPITAAPDTNEYALKAKVTPAAAGGTVEFKVDNKVYYSTEVETDGTATVMWYPETNGKHTITAIFSGRDGVAGSTTTQQVTVTTSTDPGATGSTGNDSVDSVLDKLRSLLAGLGS
ncbi:Ig-like domain repeat protein [Rhodococcus maanshanensis]|uniref:Ig-like domain (Group 3) n=1 Tax=Rhodococcus maanshanensis TaxID=183556 RepID=A0A1H7J602_9NOCA|nr:Ig-like domain repeat protein [Rhodococcus maanshanensis]SEK70203.1 Ig-like domain (group 3) [Rhodococcus maanshanensis]